MRGAIDCSPAYRKPENACGALLRTSRQQHCRNGLEQDIEVEPERPVMDVEAILLLLDREVAIAAIGHLPQARQPRRYARPQDLERGVEALAVIGRERPRSDDAHIAAQDVPELRQLI